MPQINNIPDIIKKRRSIRVFKKDRIPEHILRDIVDCGRLAPTARNLQPWKFVVITKNHTIEKIAESTDHGKFSCSSFLLYTGFLPGYQILS